MTIQKEEAKFLSDLIQKNINDITNAVATNLVKETNYSLIAAYSGLVTVMSYFDFKLREAGISDATIVKAKNNAEDHVLCLISEELNSVAQKKGEA